jgi:hypothetical protein
VTWKRLELTTAGTLMDKTDTTSQISLPIRVSKSSTLSTVAATPGPAAKKQKVYTSKTKEQQDSDWIRPNATPSVGTAPDVPTKPAGLNLPERPTRKLTVHWLYQSKYKGATQFRDLREREEKFGIDEHPLPTEQQEITVSHKTSVEELRNTIRTIYTLEGIGAQIETLSLRRYLQDGTRQAFPVTSPQSWDEQVKEQLWLPNLDLQKSVFQLTVRPSEPGELIMEQAVIAALRNVLIMRKLKIDWMFQSKSKGATQFRAFREEENYGFEVHPLPVLQKNIVVARETTIEEFRNNIRALYGLELLSGQIETLSLRRYLQDGDREAFEVTSQFWEDQVKKQLWRPDLDVEKS